MKNHDLLDFRLEKLGDPERSLIRRLTVLVGNAAVWPVHGDPEAAVEIQADDLLSYLAEFWKPLLLRQTYPILGVAKSPSDFIRAMESRWDERPISDEETEIVEAFEEAHNVASSFGGQFELPPLWLIRDRDEMICETPNRVYRLSFETTVAELARIGDLLAENLQNDGAARWDALIGAWRNRDRGEAVSLLAWSAGLNQSVADQLVSEGCLVPPTSVSDAANDNDPLRIAARLAGALPAEQIEKIIELARGFDPHEAPALDELSAQCLQILDQMPARAKPFDQGEQVARFVRAKMGFGAEGSVDILALAKGLGIEVRIHGRCPENLEGLAIAGENFGPGAYVNTKAGRAMHHGGAPSSNPAVRLTLAHELCHLLLDRGHAMSAVDVLQNRMAPLVEARAKSFAGELLLPAKMAARAWDEAGSPLELRRLTNVVKKLGAEFGVSLSVAAWKIEHGAWSAPAQLRTMLGIIAPYR
jgi:IrrE N-terminal-like domain